MTQTLAFGPDNIVFKFETTIEILGEESSDMLSSHIDYAVYTHDSDGDGGAELTLLVPFKSDPQNIRIDNQNLGELNETFLVRGALDSKTQLYLFTDSSLPHQGMSALTGDSPSVKLEAIYALPDYPSVDLYCSLDQEVSARDQHWLVSGFWYHFDNLNNNSAVLKFDGVHLYQPDTGKTALEELENLPECKSP